MAGNKNTAVSTQHSAVSHTKNQPQPKNKTRKKSKTTNIKTRRRSRRNDEERVTTFHEVEGKVIREVMLSHEGGENVLVIDFEDRTALSFEIDPEPLVLPVDIRAHYLGTRSSADRRWENLSK